MSAVTDDVMSAYRRRDERTAQALREASSTTMTRINLSRAVGEDRHGDIVVIIGGPEHGLYTVRVEKKKGEDGGEPTYETSLVRVTNVVAWRSARTETLVSTGETDQRCETTVSVMGGMDCDPAFEVVEIPHLADGEAFNPDRVLQTGIGMDPLRTYADKTVFQAMLSKLALRTSEKVQEFSTFGWYDLDDGLWFSMRGRSLGPDGTLNGDRVFPDDPKRRGGVGFYGFAQTVPTTPEEVRPLAECIRDYPSVIDATDKPYVPMALLAQAIRPVLNLPGMVVSLTAEKETGKTVLASTVIAFAAPQTRTGFSLWNYFSSADRATALRYLMGYVRNCPALFDDRKTVAGDKQRSDRIRTQADMVVSACYDEQQMVSGISGGGGTAEHGAEHIFGAIETGENRASDASRLSRTISLPTLRRGTDVVTPADRPDGVLAPLAWLHKHGGKPGTDGTASKFWTAFVAWMHRQMRTEGSWVLDGNDAGLDGMTEAASARRDTRQAMLAARGSTGGAEGGRSVQGVAGLWVALDYLRAFMRDMECEDALWSEADVEAGMRDLTRVVTSVHEDGAFDAEVLRLLRRALDSNACKVADAEGRAPSGLGPECGWGGADPDRTPTLGYVVGDGEVVLVSRAVLDDVLDRYHIVRSPEQVTDALVKLVDPTWRDRIGRRDDDRGVRVLVGGTRKRGWTLPLRSLVDVERDAAKGINAPVGSDF